MREPPSNERVCRAGPYFRPPLDENVPVINRGRLFGGACAAMFLAAATLAAACAVTYLLLRFPPPSRHAGFSLLASIKAAGLPGVLLLGMVLFFESGNESSLGGWLSTYAGSMGASPRMATAILASYWAALM